MLDYFSYTYIIIAPEKSQVCKTFKIMFVFACIYLVWSSFDHFICHMPHAFLLLFSIVSL